MVALNKYLFFILLLAVACNNAPQEQAPPDYSAVKEDLQRQNKEWYKEEMRLIEAFMKRRNWNMIPTGTGVYYAIYKKADTTLPLIKEGQIARVNFTLFVMGDTLTECYSSEGEPEDFMVSMDDVESGLHEAILFMRKGEKAKMILPSHRAHGLIGDQEMIPPRSTIVYDIELVDIIDTEQSKKIEKRNEDRKKREKEFGKTKPNS